MNLTQNESCLLIVLILETSEILAMQKKFSEEDLLLVNEILIQLLNIFDKGYQNRLVAWKAGRKITEKPVFAKSDQMLDKKIFYHLLQLLQINQAMSAL